MLVRLAKHVRKSIARFDQVEGVTDAESDRAWKRILTAAKHFDIEVEASDWREVFKGARRACTDGFPGG